MLGLLRAPPALAEAAIAQYVSAYTRPTTIEFPLPQQGFAFDGEVAFVNAVGGSMAGVLGFIAIAALCEWIGDTADLETLFPGHDGLAWRIIHFIRMAYSDVMNTSIRTFIAASALALLTSSVPAMAQTPPPLSAEASDPIKLGWMQGFPPPDDKIIRFTDPDYFAFPKLRWTVCHFRDLMPTVGVRASATAASTLPYALDPALDTVTFTPLGGGASMTWDAAFNANYSDGVLVLHRGRIVYERYGGCMNENALHGAMSVTKSLTGLLGEILVAEGALDETALAGDIIEELRGSAFGDATVRQILEMTTALDYSEDYADPNAEVWTFAAAGSPLPRPANYKGPRSYFEFLQTVAKKGVHGTAFGYKTVNADALGWLVSRTTGRSVSDYLSERVWSRIGAERDAFYTADSHGTPFAGGGFNATLRDLGRLGLLVLNQGRWNGQQVIPARAVARLRAGGDTAAFAKAGYSSLSGWSYRGMWWVSNDDHGAFAARGVHGQTIWIDPAAEMVIVRFASHPMAANAGNDPTSLPAYRAVADYLMQRSASPQLVGAEWVLEDVAGRGVVDRSGAALSFLPEGRLAGSAGCNRLMGEYVVNGSQLTITPLGTTMMACPPALMDQEQRVLALLSEVRSFAIDETGALILRTAGGERIVARRR